MNKQELGKELLNQIIQGFDVVRISRWAFELYSNNCRHLDAEILEILECLFSMEDDPQFEYSKNELKLLAKNLLNNEKHPFEGIKMSNSKKTK